MSKFPNKIGKTVIAFLVLPLPIQEIKQKNIKVFNYCKLYRIFNSIRAQLKKLFQGRFIGIEFNGRQATHALPYSLHQFLRQFPPVFNWKLSKSAVPILGREFPQVFLMNFLNYWDRVRSRLTQLLLPSQKLMPSMEFKYDLG